MKIEKINDNQIRCTLNGADLASRHINLRELAYGTEKAQRLFQEMMGFAEQHFHFDTEDMPILVEAVPISKDSIVILVTKVSYPDELDSRFSMFSDMPDDLDLFYPEDEEILEEIPLGRDAVNAGEILSLTGTDEEKEKNAEPTQNEPTVTIDPSKFVRLYQTASLDTLIALAHVLNGYYRADNTIYHPKNGSYYLLLRIGSHTAAQFNKICNIASEYATMRRMTGGTEEYFGEHARVVLPHYALQALAQMPL